MSRRRSWLRRPQDCAAGLRRLANGARARPERVVAAALVVAVGVLIYVVAIDLFPYLSVNDDEGVYLYQAAMLLEGKLFLRPGEIPWEAVRPWFFVVEGVDASGPIRMYGKYSPVAPAIFAVGRLLGDWDLALGLVAAGTAAGVYVLGSAAFDRRIGLLSVVALAGSPLFLITSATFLSYAPTTALNVAFAVAYVRAARSPDADTVGQKFVNQIGTSGCRDASQSSVRQYETPGRGRGRIRWGIAAGTAIGLAFFCRPYTAVLFAVPFVGHTLVSLVVSWRRSGPASPPCEGGGPLRTIRRRVERGEPFRSVLGRALAIALSGVAFVGLTLAYNAAVTGDPLLFPYAAFAPSDGIGFGPHEILGYELNYTPAIALETTVTIVEYFFTEWVVAGTLGTALAAVGVVWTAVRGRRTCQERSDSAAEWYAPSVRMRDAEVAVVLFGLVPSVFLGEAYFWGTHNGLRNGLIDLLGPFYHFDALVPVAVFAAAGTAALVRTAVSCLRDRTTRRRARLVVLLGLVVAAPVVASAERAVVSEPWTANAQRSENLARTYQPFEQRSFEDALVFTPDPYGDWQAHPFQYLRYDPGYDGDVVYATDGGPARDLAVLAATNRTPYRFTYRGTWTAAATPVTPEIERLRVLRGRSVHARTEVGVPADATSVSLRVETPEGYARYAVPASAMRNGTVAVEWTVGPTAAAVENFRYAEGSHAGGVPLAQQKATVELVVTFVGIGGSSVTYRQELTVGAAGEGVRVVWPPETRVCRLTTECGREGTWIGPDGDYVRGVSVAMDARGAGRPAESDIRIRAVP